MMVLMEVVGGIVFVGVLYIGICYLIKNLRLRRQENGEE